MSLENEDEQIIMIHQRTILVLGAGASAEYGFPTGTELVEEICMNLRNEWEIGVIEDVGFSPSQTTHFRDKLWEADVPSVDAFLANPVNHEYIGIGKAAVALSLVRHENLSNIQRKLADPGEEKFYTTLWRKLGTNPDEFTSSASRTTIVTFNYDRSLEYSLLMRLKAVCRDESEALQAIKQLKILHVYGMLCKPDFLDNLGGRPYRSEAKTDYRTIQRCVKSMYSPDEENAEFSEFNPGSHMAGPRDLMCFVGFGYDPINIRKLKLPAQWVDTMIIVGTAFGRSPNERYQIEASFNGKIKLGDSNDKAVEFLRSLQL